MKRKNWQHGAVIYQIYPRSFADSNGDGVGDIRGIINKLDYLGGTSDSLNVTAIWLSPIFTSPMADFGYDVADYTGIDPLFGTIDDLRELVVEAHKRDIKVLLDFVPNHSSNQHPWFLESQSSKDNPYRDWYTWRDAKPDGSPPNNWHAMFSGSAWEFSEVTNQYYLHSFLAEQPDLNWDNPEVREAMKDAMRFWLDMGVDGFRVDAIDWLSKDSQLRDDPIKPQLDHEPADRAYSMLQHAYSRDGPQLFERLNEMASVLEEYDDRFMITEGHPETNNIIHGYLAFYESGSPTHSAPFNFQGIYLPWEAEVFRNFVDAFEEVMEPQYVPIYTLGNHDEARLASRIGKEAAPTAAMMLLTLPGMAFIYYGEELGMTNVPIAPDEVQDPFSVPGKGRDPERTPMLWDGSRYAGFSDAKPWLPLSPHHELLSVEHQSHSKKSLLSLYKQLIALRSSLPALREGVYTSITVNPHVFAYERSNENQTIVILLNFSAQAQHGVIKSLMGSIQLSTYLDNDTQEINEHFILRPHEGIIIIKTK